MLAGYDQFLWAGVLVFLVSSFVSRWIVGTEPVLGGA
jgi:hypothetical protein